MLGRSVCFKRPKFFFFGPFFPWDPLRRRPALLNIGVCRDCLADSILTRFARSSTSVSPNPARTWSAAAGEISDARRRAGEERYERRFERRKAEVEPNDPEMEAEAPKRLADEEERIAREHDMIAGWSYDEFEKDMARRRAERRRKTPSSRGLLT
jgi:hypothetical protein